MDAIVCPSKLFHSWRGAGRAHLHGFTLTELMTVVAMFGVISVLAIRMYSRQDRGVSAAGLSRSILAEAHQARESALAMRRPTRLRIDISAASANTTTTLIAEMQDLLDGGGLAAASSATYTALGGQLKAPREVDVCWVSSTTSAAAPTTDCPTAAATYSIFYAADGKATLSTDSTNNGATIFMKSSDGSQKYKVTINKLTGMPKTYDSW